LNDIFRLMRELLRVEDEMDSPEFVGPYNPECLDCSDMRYCHLSEHALRIKKEIKRCHE